jgi:hypothetical protein
LIADRIWLRSVEWEATRVGDVIGARSWWRAKGKVSASAFASRPAWNKRSRRRAIAPVTARFEGFNRQAGCAHAEAPSRIAVADRRRFRDD